MGLRLKRDALVNAKGVLEKLEKENVVTIVRKRAQDRSATCTDGDGCVQARPYASRGSAQEKGLFDGQ